MVHQFIARLNPMLSENYATQDRQKENELQYRARYFSWRKQMEGNGADDQLGF